MCVCGSLSDSAWPVKAAGRRRRVGPSASARVAACEGQRRASLPRWRPVGGEERTVSDTRRRYARSASSLLAVVRVSTTGRPAGVDHRRHGQRHEG